MHNKLKKFKANLIIASLVLAAYAQAMDEVKEDPHAIKSQKHMTTSADVLIVGAGASGLTLAIDLARRGVNFQIIEKLDGPHKASRGAGIQPRTQEVFEDLGILDRAFGSGGVIPLVRDYDKEGGYKESAFSPHQDLTPSVPYPTPLMLPQYLTETIMCDRLAELGSFPRFSSELKGFEENKEGVIAHILSLKGVETIQARYLIGADGGQSFVRKAIRTDFPGKTLGARLLVADVKVDGVGRDAWHRWNKEDGANLVLLNPLAGTDLFVLILPQTTLEGELDLTSGGLTASVAQRTGRNDIVIRSVSWASAFNMNARLADHYNVGRIFLTGDAAHVHPPAGGQGLNTSVQDAYNLGWKLAAVLNGASEKLLLTYEEERRLIAAQMLGLSTKILAASKQGDFRRGKEVLQLDIGYPESSLAFEKPKRTEGILAGDRAPDAPVRGAAGQPTRLFNLFQGPHWTLLGYEVGLNKSLVKPRPGLHIHAIGAHGDIVDDAGHFAKGYSVKPGNWVLVRPDGYIGAIVATEELESLEAYLNNVGLKI